jgi:hypothetical protein
MEPPWIVLSKSGGLKDGWHELCDEFLLASERTAVWIRYKYLVSLWRWIRDREVVEGTLWVWRIRSAVESCKRCRSDSSVYYKVQ